VILRLIEDYEKALPAGGWPNWVLGNHDQPRIAARVGEAQARVAAMLLLTLRGTPTMYYGDEIALPRVEVAPEFAHDPWGKREPGLGVSRDPWRTPMQWDESENAGFSISRPWLPVEPDYRHRNIERLRTDPRSILSLYRRLIGLRRAHPALHVGSQRVLGARDNVLTFERSHDSETVRVVLNFGAETHALQGFAGEHATVLLSSHLDRDGLSSAPELRPHEGLILRIDSSAPT
jgi:alpha-glucosidase